MQQPGPPNRGASGGPYATLWRDITSFIFDLRFLQIVGQILFAIILVAIVSRIFTDMLLALDQQGLTPNFNFFQNRAGFEIGERPDWYSADSSYWQAFQVGLINTLRVVVVGLFSATFLGILVGVFLLSSNWLMRTISRVYVELLRNTPLLVQLFVFYFIGVLSLPVLTDAIAIPPEGVSLIPLRLAIYAVLLILILRRYPTGERLRFPALLALVVTVGALEFAFAWQTGHSGWLVADGQSMRGELGYAPFLVYALGSLLLIGAAWFLPQILVRFRRDQPDDEIVLSDDGQPTFLGMEYTQLRSFLLALLGGQLLGGLLYYFGLMPDTALRAEIYPQMYLSNRGVFLPELITTSRFTEWLAFVGLGLLAAAAIWAYYGRIMETTGRLVPRMRLALLALIGCAVVGWFLVGVEPNPETVVVSQDGQAVIMPLEDARAQGLLTLDDERVYSHSPLIFARPERQGLRFKTGTEITPEFMALFLGLSIYTSAFIAEIVRAGIQAVPYGQIEAARALGLSQSQTLRMIVLPQALRVIIPPLGNQYLNLAKNSSLAIAIGFADFYQIATTVMNQSGQSVTGIAVVMMAYLTLSLTISGGANWVNRRFQLVTR